MSYERPQVAYFCMEFGLSERLTIYSGGLGVLAGDFLRSARALDLPVVGVGIAWAEGYTRQEIGADGAPHDLAAPLDRSLLVREAPTVHVTVAGHDVPLAIWRVDGADHVPLYLLEPKETKDQWMTRRLYGGGEDDRVAQEIILGVGGVRALQALGLRIEVHHFNEGHAVFAGLELMRRLRDRGHSFDAAWEMVREHIVFTTHTPVDVGNEKHDLDRLRRLGASAGFSAAEVERIGGRPFNMTVAGLRLSKRANAVAELHGETARRMWAHIHDGAPIEAITNGVDHRVWQDARIAAARTPEELWRAHESAKMELMDEIARRATVKPDPGVLTIGFARRATAYKRALLFFADPRAGALLDSGRVQLVFAGKAHPRDHAGGQMIRELVELAGQHPGRVTFLPNYDLSLGRLLTRGCDVWLNTPRRPLEACGTSGMKAAMNGLLNLSILDGWWVEGCRHGVNGWQIGDAVDHPLEPEGDAADAAALHELLEAEVIPRFYNQRAEWLAMMRAAIDLSVERFSADRMVRDYFERLYRPTDRAKRRRRAAMA
jgi:starch phosphorylase